MPFIWDLQDCCTAQIETDFGGVYAPLADALVLPAMLLSCGLGHVYKCISGGSCGSDGNLQNKILQM